MCLGWDKAPQRMRCCAIPRAATVAALSRQNMNADAYQHRYVGCVLARTTPQTLINPLTQNPTSCIARITSFYTHRRDTDVKPTRYRRPKSPVFSYFQGLRAHTQTQQHPDRRTLHKFTRTSNTHSADTSCNPPPSPSQTARNSGRPALLADPGSLPARAGLPSGPDPRPQ